MTIKYRVKTVKKTIAVTEGTHSHGGKEVLTNRVVMDYTQMLCHIKMCKVPNAMKLAAKAKVDGYATSYHEVDGHSYLITIRRIKL